jgi:ankyrin repeat protein
LPVIRKAPDVGRNVMRTLIFILLLFVTSASNIASKDPWDKDQSQWSLLMKLAYAGDTQRIKILLSKGEKVNAKNVNGWTPLKVAVKNKQTITVSYLLRQNADPNLADNDGLNSLMEACLHNHFDIARILLQNGANPNLTNKVGWTALMGATSFGDTKTMELLLKFKANVNAKRETDGMTALDLAKYNNDNQKINLLLKYGAK